MIVPAGRMKRKFGSLMFSLPREVCIASRQGCASLGGKKYCPQAQLDEPHAYGARTTFRLTIREVGNWVLIVADRKAWYEYLRNGIALEYGLLCLRSSGRLQWLQGVPDMRTDFSKHHLIVSKSSSSS